MLFRLGAEVVEVDVTVSVKSASLFAGGVIVRPARSAGASVQVPLLLFVPAESVAPDGTPEITTDRLSDGSVAEVEIEKGFPVTVCSGREVDLAERVAKDLYGDSAWMTMKTPKRWSWPASTTCASSKTISTPTSRRARQRAWLPSTASSG